jgi:hypothetical protein
MKWRRKIVGLMGSELKVCSNKAGSVIWRNTEAHSFNHCYSGVGLYTWVSIMQCTCAILSSVAFSTLQMFQNYIINSTIFKKKKIIEHIIRVLDFKLSSCSVCRV